MALEIRSQKTEAKKDEHQVKRNKIRTASHTFTILLPSPTKEELVAASPKNMANAEKRRYMHANEPILHAYAYMVV